MGYVNFKEERYKATNQLKKDVDVICAVFNKCTFGNIKFKNCSFIGCMFNECNFGSGRGIFENCLINNTFFY